MTTARSATAAVRELPADDLLALTEALVAVPSVSLHERELADAVEARLRDHGGTMTVERVGDNVVARTDNGLAKRVLIGGHLDTVPENGNLPGQRDGDTLRGLGTSDMKGGLAVMLRLAEEAAASRHDLTLVFYVAEEIAEEHNGLRDLFERRPDLVAGDLAILMEPTDGWVEAGCQGTIHLRADFEGARAHTARPWMGENALHRAGRMLARLDAHEAPTVTVEGLEFRESLQAVQIEGGVARNVVPDRCSVVVNRRYAPGPSPEEAVAETESLLHEADSLDVVSVSAAAPPGLSDPLVAEFVGTLDLRVRPKLGWTDVARFTSHGVPALNFGPGDPEMAHTAGERVDRASLVGSHRVLAWFLGIDRSEPTS